MKKKINVTMTDEAKNFFTNLKSIPMSCHEVSEELIDKLNAAIKTIREDKAIWFSTENLPHEIWRDIKGSEGFYKISIYGRIKSFCKGRVKILVSRFNRGGYVRVNLSKNGLIKTKSLHSLVAKEFHLNPENKPQINHEDGDKENNCVWNLSWSTGSENKRHAFKIGLLPSQKGTNNPRAKLTEEQVSYIRKHYKPYDRKFGARALARKFNVCSQVVYDIAHYKTYKNIP